MRALDDEQLTQWFGSFITRYRNAQSPAPPARPLSMAMLEQKLARGARLSRHPYSRLAARKSGSKMQVFLAGDRFLVSARLYRLLSAPDQADGRAWQGLTSAERSDLLGIINAGHFGIGR